MPLSVTAETTIARPRGEVAAYAMDPAHDPTWIGGIKTVEKLTEGPVRQGTQVRRMAAFMGKRIEYVLEVAEHREGTLLAMRSVKSPFPMQVTYEFADDGPGTRVRIRVQGEPGGFYKLAGPLMARSVSRNVSSDLKRLKTLLERPPSRASAGVSTQ